MMKDMAMTSDSQFTWFTPTNLLCVSQQIQKARFEHCARFGAFGVFSAAAGFGLSFVSAPLLPLLVTVLGSLGAGSLIYSAVTGIRIFHGNAILSKKNHLRRAEFNLACMSERRRWRELPDDPRAPELQEFIDNFVASTATRERFYRHPSPGSISQPGSDQPN